MKTFEVTYTWTGTLDLEATDEDDAIEKAREEMMKHHTPMNLFDCEDRHKEVTG